MSKFTTSAALTLSLLTTFAFGEDLISSGTITGVCSFDSGSITNGVMIISSDLTTLSSSTANGGTPSSIQVSNNDPGAYQIIVTAASGFSAKPASFNDSGVVFNVSYELASGGSNPTSQPIPTSTNTVLTNPGTDTIQITNSPSTSNGVYIAGTYSLTNTVTCAAN